MRLARRFMMGLAVLLALAPYGGIFLTASLATLLSCEVNEMKVLPCPLFGADIGGFLNGMLMTGGLGQVTIPILMFVLTLWLIVEAYAWRRRARKARKRAKATGLA